MLARTSPGRIAIGDVFGRLTVRSLPEKKPCGKGVAAMSRCECSCGRTLDVVASNLLKGNSKSCGCRTVQATVERNRTHGFSGTRIYGIWAGVVKRCEDAKDPRWADYGGRGITVFPGWRHDFETFFDWAMANGYAHDLTIERKDVDGNYEPENCTWVTMAAQARNKRNSRVFTAFGETKCLAMWARDPRCRVDLTCLGSRIRGGMNPEKALALPVQTWKRRATSKLSGVV